MHARALACMRVLRCPAGAPSAAEQSVRVQAIDSMHASQGDSFFVANVENYIVTVRHTGIIISGGQTMMANDGSTELKDVTEASPILYGFVGKERQAVPDAFMPTSPRLGMADSMKLTTIMHGVGIVLDQESKTSLVNNTNRFEGLKIRLSVHYYNVGDELHYDYYVTPFEMTVGFFEAMYRSVCYRTLYQVHGIEIELTSQGIWMYFNLWTLLLHLAAGVTGLKLVSSIIDSVVIARVPGFRLFKYRKSPLHDVAMKYAHKEREREEDFFDGSISKEQYLRETSKNDALSKLAEEGLIATSEEVKGSAKPVYRHVYRHVHR